MAISARTGFFTAALGGLILVGLVSACSGDDEEDGPVARPPRPLPGSSSPTPTEGDTTPAQALTNNGKCEELGSLVGATGQARYVSSDVRSLSLPLANRPVASRIAIVGIGTRSELLGVDTALGAAENANYETCTHCLVIAVGCTTDCTAGTWFFPRSGKGTFTSVPNVSGDSFRGTFEDVTLEEVRVDFNTGRSTPVPLGACFHVSTLSFDAVAKSATTSGTTSSSGGSTTSSGGSTTSSSGGTTSSSGGTGSSSGSGGGGKGADSLRTKTRI